MASSDPTSDWNPKEAASLSELAITKSRDVFPLVPLTPAELQSRACLVEFKHDVAAGRLKGEFALKQWVAEEHSRTFPIPVECLDSWPDEYTAEESTVCMETTLWFIVDQGEETGDPVCARYRIGYVFLRSCSPCADDQLAGDVSLQDIGRDSVLPGVTLASCDWDWIECADGKCDLHGEKGVYCLNCFGEMHLRDVFETPHLKLTSFSYAALDTAHVVYMEKQIRATNGPAQVKVYPVPDSPSLNQPRAVGVAESWGELLDSDSGKFVL